MASLSIDTLITREFSFIQELIWSAPYRNPFPKCSDKVIWDLKTMKSIAQQEALQHLEPIFDADASMLIEVRRILCNVLPSVRVYLCGNETMLIKLENELDSIIVQHMNSSWTEGERLRPDRIDLKVLAADVKQCLEKYAGVEAEKLFEFPQLEISGETAASTLSSTKSTEECNTVGTAEPALSHVCVASCEEDIAKDVTCESDDMEAPEKLVEAKELDFRPEDLDLHSITGGEVLKDGREELMDIEMTMKVRLCDLDARQPSWRVIFGLVNHSGYRIDVDALSFWPLDGSCQATTIKWPRGEVTLQEDLSFICYSVKVSCKGLFDSPQLGFSWSYKKSIKKTELGKRSRMELAEGCHCSMRMNPSVSEGDTGADKDRCFGKRLRSLLFNWHDETPETEE